MTRIAWAAFLAGVLLAPACLAEQTEVQQTLENCLRIRLKPIPKAEQIALTVLFDVGEDQDPEGMSGLAHLVEHLYVTAAAGEGKARTVREYMERYPQGWNAQTGDRFTVIATVFPPEKLEEELADAAARMGDLRITEADLEREKPRMLEELRNMFGGMPALAARNLARELCRPSPAGARKGGIPDQVRRITVAQVRDRWTRFYKPRNALIVLAGKFDADAAGKSLALAFSGLPSGETAPDPRPGEKPRAGVLEEVSIEPAGGSPPPELCLAFPVPPPGDALYAPFLVLAAKIVLRAMKKDGAGGADCYPASFSPIDDPSVFYVSGPVLPGETGEQAVERLQRLVSDPLKEGLKPRDTTMARSVFCLQLGTAPFMETMQAGNAYGAGFSLGRREQMGIDSKTLIQAINSVKQEDLARAAKACFDPSRRSAAIVRAR